MEDKRKGVSLNQGLLDHSETIEELHQGLGQYRKAKADRPVLEGRRIASRTDAANLLKQIRPGMSIDDIETLRPSLAKRKTIQTLGAKHEAHVQNVRKTERHAQSVSTDLKKVRDDLKALSAVSDVRKLSQAVSLAQKAGGLDGEITTRRSGIIPGPKKFFRCFNSSWALGRPSRAWSDNCRFHCRNLCFSMKRSSVLSPTKNGRYSLSVSSLTSAG